MNEDFGSTSNGNGDPGLHRAGGGMLGGFSLIRPLLSPLERDNSADENNEENSCESVQSRSYLH